MPRREDREHQGISRYTTPLRLVRAARAPVVVPVVMLGLLLLLSPPPVARASGAAEADQRPVDLASLNVRLSTQVIRPPEAAVTRTVVLPDLRPARPLYGEPARSAILEDDARRRVLILSMEAEGASPMTLRAHLLHDFELERYLPELVACARVRRCAFDRTPATGGLACIALCLAEALRQ